MIFFILNSRTIYILLLCFIPVLCWSQETESEFNDSIDRNDPDFVTASLMIADPGGVLYSCLGHACLRLECPTFGLDYIFSYESEDVKEKVFTFLSGNLKMGMFAIPLQEYLDEYIKEQRGVRQYRLNLPIDVKRDLWQILDEKCAEGANLPYDYLVRGCAQSTFNVLLQALDTTKVEWGAWSDKYNQTRREIASSYLTPYPWSLTFLHALVGDEIDKDCSNFEKVIVPNDLLEFLQNAKINGTPIISEAPKPLVPSTKETKTDSWFTPLILSLFLLLLSLISFFIKKPYIDLILLAIQTLIGLFLTYLVVFSTLPCTEWNWLLIPFNPLPLFFWKWRKHWALLFALILVTWEAVMLLSSHQLTDSAYIVFTFALILMYLKQSRVYTRIYKKVNR